MHTQLLFGFGSLINTASLQKTAPHASDIRPAYIKGFRREFNLTDTIAGWSGGKFTDVPYCALDISETGDSHAKVNGVAFLVDDDCVESLTKREHGYKLVETTVYDFESNEPIGTCRVFSACKNDGAYDAESPSQIKYLELCAEGTKQYGEKFYQTFLETTYVDNQRLCDLPELTKQLTD